MKTSLLRSALSVMMMSMIAACADKTETPKEQSVAETAELERQTEKASDHDDKHQEESDDHSKEKASSEIRSAEAHIHGDAELAVVVDADVVTIELETPLYNLLGFEHHPETAAQKTKVEMAEGQLQKGEALFVFNAEAKCNLMSESKAVHLFDEDHEEHDDHEEHHDDHEEHDDEEHDDDEHHDDEYHDEDESSHKDALLQYQYRCAAPSSLENVSVNLFEFFEDMSDIDVTYLGPSTQKQVSLTRKNTQMDLSR